MGLEIYYDLHAPPDWTSEHVRLVVNSAWETVPGLGFADAGTVVANNPSRLETLGLKDPLEGQYNLRATAVDGWLFRTWPGEGCESAFFGLCRFPGSVTFGNDEIPTGWGEGWHFHTWCKTQYADRVSREHFMKCHLGVVAILDAFRIAGVEVNARDGSGYWEHRDKSELIRQLDEWNGVVAAVAGAFKDATDERPGRVVSPMFSAPDFEHLEAKGHDVLRRKREEQAQERPDTDAEERR